MQAISGWDMGKCRVPTGASSTVNVNYITGEIIDMPIHINRLDDSPDAADIYITGTPDFRRSVAMGESRYKTDGSDKYSSVIDLFTAGIYFNQPDSKISDANAVQSKVDRFRDTTDASYQFTPTVVNGGAGFTANVRLPAVHLEFFVDPNGAGKVRITNDCIVRGFQQNQDSRTSDFKVTPGSTPQAYERYLIYGYHVRPSTDNRIIRRIDETYVTQSFGGVSAVPGGQIYVNGNVIISSSDPCLADPCSGGARNVVKDKITVVATGNIWIANEIKVAGAHDANGKPTMDNPNVLGLLAQGVIKVVDPNVIFFDTGGPNPPNNFVYVPIGLPDNTNEPNSYYRHLPNPMVVEAGMTVGGGGWGAENVKTGSYGGRKNGGSSTALDTLIIRGTLTESIRGLVGRSPNGYLKQYYLDERLLTGILPGNIGLQGKFIPTPAGWRDYRN
jgi:hypothetical protein